MCQGGEATFQLAIITDGVASYALILHHVGLMNWQETTNWQDITVGVSDGSGHVQKSMYSGTTWAYKIDELIGNTGNGTQH